MTKSFINLTPQELDALLKEKYNFGLSTLMFALYSAITQRPDNRKSAQKIKNLKQRILSQKRKIVELIGDYEFISFPGRTARLRKEFIRDYPKDYEMQILDKFKLRDFFSSLGEMTKALNGYTRKIGRPSAISNYLVFQWESTIKLHTGASNWKLLANLFSWFQKKLGRYEFYKEFSPKNQAIIDPEYLKNQSYKMLRKSNFSDILKSLKQVSLLTTSERQGFLKKICETHSDLFYWCEKKALILSDQSILRGPTEWERLDISKVGEKRRSYYEKILAREIDHKRIPVRFINFAYRYYLTKLLEKNPELSSLIIFPDLSYLAW
jgi:hypothetical protein